MSGITIYEYDIMVKFNDGKCTPDERRLYFLALDKYKCAGIGRDKYGTSTMHFFSREKISKEDIAKDLGGLEIISFMETRSD